MSDTKRKSSWGEFLNVRAKVIDELHADGQSDAEIARVLSMDGPGQVRMIRTRDRATEMTAKATKVPDEIAVEFNGNEAAEVAYERIRATHFGHKMPEWATLHPAAKEHFTRFADEVVTYFVETMTKAGVKMESHRLGTGVADA